MKQAKVFILSVVFTFLLATAAFSSPFLVCDPYPVDDGQPTHFVLVIDNGTPITTTAYKKTDGSVILRYNLAKIAVGKHTAKVRAKNMWGVSAQSVPFVFTRKLPTTPTGSSVTGQ